MAGNFFRGTSVEQDGRWGKSDERLMAKMASKGMFASILETKINIKKVNVDVISKWITQKVIEVLGFEDEIVINLIINMLQGDVIDGRKMQLGVTGFLEKKTPSFMEELWTLLVDAQNNQPSGIPSIFINCKKEEILLRQASTVPVRADSNTTHHDETRMVTKETKSSIIRDDGIRDVVDSRDRSRDRVQRTDRDRDDSRDRHRSTRNDDNEDRKYKDRSRGRSDDRDGVDHRDRSRRDDGYKGRHDRDDYRSRVDRDEYRDRNSGRRVDDDRRDSRGDRHRSAYTHRDEEEHEGRAGRSRR